MQPNRTGKPYKTLNATEANQAGSNVQAGYDTHCESQLQDLQCTVCQSSSRCHDRHLFKQQASMTSEDSCGAYHQIEDKANGCRQNDGSAQKVASE